MSDDAVMRTAVGECTIELVVGDITTEQVDAIVNAANPSLQGGGGVDGAIHRVAGPELAEAGRRLAPCPPGEARITPGFALPARFVIHTVGPIYRDGASGEAEILAAAHRASLALAEDHALRTIAFPAISTGVYGYPVDDAAPVAVDTVATTLATGTGLRLVRFVLFSQPAYDSFAAALSRL